MKQKRYLAKDGERDWIDKCADKLMLDEFIGAMFFTIGKYYQRMGKKDPEVQELGKIEDYKKRWISVLNENHGFREDEAMKIVNKNVAIAKQLAQE